MQGRRSEFNDTPLPEWFTDYILMRRTGWTYTELDAQPDYRIAQLLTMFALEDEVGAAP